MPILFSKLKNQLESERSSYGDLPFDLKVNDGKILRPKLIDPDIFDIYKSIPLDPQAFYEDIGCPILYPNTGQQIRQLADYQVEFWKSTLSNPYGLGYNYACCIKSNKIGLTTSELYGDFQSLAKLAPGRQVLVVAQTQEMANDHLYSKEGYPLK